MKISRSTWSVLGKVGLAGACIFLVGAGITMVRSWLKPAATSAAPEPSNGPQLVCPDTLFLPPETMQSLGIRTVEARRATRRREIAPLAGSLAMDNGRLARVQSRFPGEVVEIGTTATGLWEGLPWPYLRPFLTSFPALIAAYERPLRYGDRVWQGQVLAVIWSKDLGEKKSELVDALSQSHLDRDRLKALEEAFREGAASESQLREARRNVQASAVAEARAERTLAAWRLTASEIAVIRAEAERLIAAQPAPRFDPSWARVELRAPLDGTLMEKNINAGDMVDPTANLFKIVDLSRLTVWAHIYEEDLPALRTLERPIPWSIRLIGDADAAPILGSVDTIGQLIDPTQHTALLTGSVDNRAGRLRPGQFITASIELPKCDDEVEIPAKAIYQDGLESVVFVQPDPDKNHFTRRHVLVTRQFQDVVYVRSQIKGDEGGPPGHAVQPLVPGERVVVHNAMELRQTLDNLHNTGASPK